MIEIVLWCAQVRSLFTYTSEMRSMEMESGETSSGNWQTRRAKLKIKAIALDNKTAALIQWGTAKGKSVAIPSKQINYFSRPSQTGCRLSDLHVFFCSSLFCFVFPHFPLKFATITQNNKPDRTNITFIFEFINENRTKSARNARARVHSHKPPSHSSLIDIFAAVIRTLIT